MQLIKRYAIYGSAQGGGRNTDGNVALFIREKKHKKKEMVIMIMINRACVLRGTIFCSSSRYSAVSIVGRYSIIVLCTTLLMT